MFAPARPTHARLGRRTHARHALAGALVLALLAVPASASAATYEIDATNFDFSPANLTIDQGNLVRWMNKRGTHEVDVNKPSTYIATNPRSSVGQISERTVVAGTFPFVCSIHSSYGMKGKLKVKPTLTRSGSTVTVRLGPVTSAFHHVIQRRRGTSGSWASSTTTAGADSKAFTLSSGTWQFRAKLVRTSNGSSSSNSPIVSIYVP